MCPKITIEYEQERRCHILDAAAWCFARKGYQATTIDAVAMQAGLSKGAVYVYFSSKEVLLLEVVEYQQTRIAQKLARVFPEKGAALEKLEAYAAAYFSMLGEGKAGECSDLKVAVQLWAELAKNEKTVAAIQRDYGYWRTTLAGLIREGITQGEFAHHLDPDMTAMSLLAAIDGFIWQSLWLGEDFNWQAAHDALMALVRDGLVKRR